MVFHIGLLHFFIDSSDQTDSLLVRQDVLVLVQELFLLVEEGHRLGLALSLQLHDFVLEFGQLVHEFGVRQWSQLHRSVLNLVIGPVLSVHLDAFVCSWLEDATAALRFLADTSQEPLLCAHAAQSYGTILLHRMQGDFG